MARNRLSARVAPAEEDVAVRCHVRRDTRGLCPEAWVSREHAHREPRGGRSGVGSRGISFCQEKLSEKRNVANYQFNQWSAIHNALELQAYANDS